MGYGYIVTATATAERCDWFGCPCWTIERDFFFFCHFAALLSLPYLYSGGLIGGFLPVCNNDAGFLTCYYFAIKRIRH